MCCSVSRETKITPSHANMSETQEGNPEAQSYTTTPQLVESVRPDGTSCGDKRPITRAINEGKEALPIFRFILLDQLVQLEFLDGNILILFLD